MNKTILPIPATTEGIVDTFICDLTYSGLKKDHAIFLLGSLVYQSPNERGERKFNEFAQDIPKFQAYLSFFLDNNMLVRGREKESYSYHYDVAWERYLENYEFDSAVIQAIIEKEFPNFHKYLENAFEFLKPNITRTSPPF